MALDTNRVLRVGVVFRGQVLAERVLDRRVEVTVGTRIDCTVHINPKDHPEFPETRQVATLYRDTYHLILPDLPNVHVNLRGGPAGSQGIDEKQVVKVKERRLLPIEAFTGGSIAIGDIILMFQFVRSDSVPTKTHEETVLRIGLVHESRLLSDKIFQAGQVIRVGSERRATIVLDDDDYKGPSASFKVGHDGKVTVELPKGSALRLASGSTPMDEAEAIRQGVARRKGDGLELVVGLKSRGRASLGPYTLLFQVVRRTMTVPVMPRKSLIGQMINPMMNDPVWSVSFIVSLVLIGSVVAQAIIFQQTTGRYLKRQFLEEYQALGTYEVLVEEKEDPEPKVDIKSEKAKEEEAKELEKEVEKKKPEKKKPESLGKTVDPEERKRQARKAIAKNTIAGAFMGQGASTKLFAEGGEGEGVVVAKTFGGGDGDGDAPMKGLDIKGDGGGGTVEKVHTGRRKGFGERDQLKTKVSKDKTEKKVSISLSAGSLSGSGAGKSGVARVIARKNSAVRRCYEAALRQNPGLTGKVKVRFTVGTAGTITSVSVLGASGTFASCIKGKFSRIRGLPLLPSPQSFSQSYVFTKS